MLDTIFEKIVNKLPFGKLDRNQVFLVTIYVISILSIMAIIVLLKY